MNQPMKPQMKETDMTPLTAMMGTYKKTAPLKDGSVASPLVRLDFADVDTARKAFKDVVRGLKFDVAELAVVTFLQAYEAGKPYVMLPFVMNGMFHHKSILCRADDDLQPQNLAGKTVAMRSYPQTTPTWGRGILSDEYGVELDKVRWLTQEGAHVAEARDPEFVTRIDSTLSLEDMLRAGEVDAIIAGGALSGDPGIRTLIAEPKEAAAAAYRRTGVVPINHVVTIRKEIAETRIDLVREVFHMLLKSREASGELPPADGPDLQPVGFDALRPALETVIRYAHEQKLISRRYAVEELYGNVGKILD
ncbi:substrate-binding domain-containing protein [Paraburkholderia antibiotica]|uniref:Phosphate ABC transporter substrate-binding protein n=1 Tax=Paraburkholderia antibiotica TaxID=2728839 RepID=A0A7X9X6X0_9BURK|nr:phosphate ABC transporter substrate-binding protein [Paraburkholderia antibiotica]NML32596.1 phosphate ABC transporter substrate-binding protein [Paraburkholderia antibiotica]